MAYIPGMKRTLVADDKMKQNNTKNQKQKSYLNIWNQDLFLENSYKHQTQNYMQRLYLIPVQNKSSLCTSILSYEDNFITRHLMLLFFWVGAVQNRIYQHVCVCKEQACTSTIKLSVSGSMCRIHSPMPLHGTVNNRDEPALRKDYMFADSKTEYL